MNDIYSIIAEENSLYTITISKTARLVIPYLRFEKSFFLHYNELFDENSTVLFNNLQMIEGHLSGNIIIRDEKGVYRLKLCDMMYMLWNKDRTIITMLNGPKISINRSLEALSQIIDSGSLMQISSSITVNIANATIVSKSYVVMKDGEIFMKH